MSMAESENERLFLEALTQERISRPIKVVPAADERTVFLVPVFCVGTVHSMVR
jgi:hypothetical protein